MSSKASSIVGWVLAALVSLFMIFASGLPKLLPVTDEATIAFINALGVAEIGMAIGVLEILIGILFLIPRTTTIGYVLLIGLLGGAMATSLTHSVPGNWWWFPLIIIALASVAAYIRSPELLDRVMQRKVPVVSKAGKITGWVLATLVGLMHIPALIGKFVPPTPEAAAMNAQLGMDLFSLPILGVVEIITLGLFFYPRTSTLGFIMMVGYMSGVLATFLTHTLDMSIVPMYVILGLLTLSAWFRNRELASRVMGKIA